MIRMEPMSIDQQNRLRESAAAIGLREAALISLGLCHALRASEFGMLRVSDINLRDNTISIRRLKKSRSTVERLMPSEIPVIREWIGSRSGDSPLFPNLCRMTVYRLFRKCAEAANLPSTCRAPHSMKHSLLQRMCDAGLSLPQLMKVGGHKNANSSLRYYEARQSQVDDLKEKILAANAA